MNQRFVAIGALAAVGLFAQDRTDRDAIHQAIGALNQRNWRAATITSDPTALAQFERLLRRKNLTYRIRPGAGRPTVVASQHGMFAGRPVKLAAPSFELQNPRVVAGAVRFLSEDAAEANASLVEWKGTLRESTPLLFVMKKEAGVWKIAELRVTGDPQLPVAVR